MSKGPEVGLESGRKQALMSGEETETDEAEKAKATSEAFPQTAHSFRLYPAGAAGPGSGMLWIGGMLGSQICV